MKSLPYIILLLTCGALFLPLFPGYGYDRPERENLRRLYRLSEIYERGSDTVRPDTIKSLLLLREAAEGGLPEAQNYLGFLYMTGKLTPAKPDSALFWLRKASDNGFSTATANIGFMYAEGLGVEKDTLKAMEWLSKAADYGNPAAECQFADLVISGNNTLGDTLMAADLYERAARHGFPKADMKLSLLMSPSWEKLPSDSLLSLARDYSAGSLPRSAVAILRLILSREEEGRSRLGGDAATLLAHSLSNGRGIPYNHARAEALFLKGALLGNAEARTIIAESLEIFPDFLSRPENQKVLNDFFEKNPIPKEIFSPSYWNTDGYFR